MNRSLFGSLGAALCLSACSTVTGDRVVVTGAGSELLKLRAGPSLEFNVLMGLPDGTVLNRRDCVTELNQRWCEVSVVGARGATGYVAADYIAPE